MKAQHRGSMRGQNIVRSSSYDPQRFHATQSVSALQAATTQVPLGSNWSMGSTTNLTKAHDIGNGRRSYGGRSGSSTSLWRSSNSGYQYQRGKPGFGKNPNMANSYNLTNSHNARKASANVANVASENENNRNRRPKIIFLDVDGVLHSIRVARQEQLFNPQKMALLRKIVQNTDASIVLSSAWRRTAPTLRMAYQMLNKHGIDSPIDITPDFGICGKRSNEILTWVDKHQITNWVAIDDLDLGTGEPRLRGHFIKTNPLIGLTNELVEQAISLLNMEVGR